MRLSRPTEDKSKPANLSGPPVEGARKLRVRLALLFLGWSMIAGSAVVYGIERRITLIGLPEDVGTIGSKDFSALSYRIQNLTPFNLRLVARLEGCSDKAKVNIIGPYGSLTVSRTIAGSDYLPGKHVVMIEAIGYCRNEPFLVEKTVSFEVVSK